MSPENEKIRITSDEVARVVIGPLQTDPPPAGIDQSHVWGHVQSTEQAANQSRGSSFLLQAWVYLGISGLIGAFIAWAICEPSFSDFANSRGVGNFLLMPAFVTSISLGFALAESIVERSLRKAIIRGVIALVVGVVFGFLFHLIAQFVYEMGLTQLYRSGVRLNGHSPLHWIVRAVAWSIFGVTGGVVYGIAGQSIKKCAYGIIGGIIGAGIGGFIFDPISFVTNSGGPSRCIGLALMGAFTGIAIGLVEAALKDRWLYVSSGPLAGKQFILYKPQTSVGRDQSNDIYLFKDPTIQPRHAVIDVRSGKAVVIASAPTLVSGQSVTQRALQNGDTIQIGRYTFNYQEKPRAT